jgi:hypothetical protein
MNRKLHNTIAAFSVTGVMFFVGLMAAQPTLPMVDANGGSGNADSVTFTPSTLPIRVTVHDPASVNARVQSRVERFEDEVAKAGSTSQAIALTAGFIATVAVDAAVAGALLEARQSDTDAEEAKASARASAAARARAVRSSIAVPYFSFARGSQRGARS